MTNIIKPADDLQHANRAAVQLAQAGFDVKVKKDFVFDVEVVVVEVKNVSPGAAEDVDGLMALILARSR